MKLAQPIKSVRDQEIANFVAAVIENISAPVGMLALAWIEMFVKRSTVEPTESKRVFRKMRRHPVHDHADSFLMKMIDEKTKIIRRAVTRRGSKIRADLITPRRAVRMFFERQKLDVSESILLHIVSQQRRDLAIA